MCMANGLADESVATEAEAVQALRIYLQTITWPKYKPSRFAKQEAWLTKLAVLMLIMLTLYQLWVIVIFA